MTNCINCISLFQAQSILEHQNRCLANAYKLEKIKNSKLCYSLEQSEKHFDLIFEKLNNVSQPFKGIFLPIYFL
jgi:hypothetical protein